MKIALIIVAVLIVIPVLMAVIGLFLPKAHVAARTADYGVSVDALYASARNFVDQPSWRTGIVKIELLPEKDGLVRFREFSRHGAITYLVTEDRPSQRLVTKIADDSLAFGGTWTLEFSSNGTGSGLRITENGIIRNPIFRLLSRTVFSTTATMETYLRDLGRKFGETVTPR